MQARYSLLVGTVWLLAALGILGALTSFEASTLSAAMAACVATAGGLTLFLMAHLRRRVLAIHGEREALREREAYIHSHDEATGALTRASFLMACDACFREAGTGEIHALLLIDLDYLKQINDAFGHEVGDAALRRLTSVAEAVAPDALFGRLGGDEFALLLKGTVQDAVDVARRFLLDLSQMVNCAGRSISLSASVGVAMAEGQGLSVDETMRHADLALYESKRGGRAQATVFDIEMLRDQNQDRFYERELRAAILMNELELAYQPIVGTENELRACEALLRWRHPVRGLIAPSEFIPVAERSLLIDMLGEWVLRRACLDFADEPQSKVGVNFSANQFKRDDVVMMVERVLRETGMPATRLAIEITESVAMNASKAVLDRLHRLRAMGIHISLDDFGAGHCGFSYLRNFPVDSIKIDRSFVGKLEESEVDRTILLALTQVSRALGLKIIAEGIETEDQRLIAGVAGCDLFQGYHIARPQPLAQIKRDWLRHRLEKRPIAEPVEGEAVAA